MDDATRIIAEIERLIAELRRIAEKPIPRNDVFTD